MYEYSVVAPASAAVVVVTELLLSLLLFYGIFPLDFCGRCNRGRFQIYVFLALKNVYAQAL